MPHATGLPCAFLPIRAMVWGTESAIGVFTATENGNMAFACPPLCGAFVHRRSIAANLF